jgi:hypothetical protein
MTDKPIRSAEELVDKHYEEMFDWLVAEHDTDFVEFVIEVKTASDGKTIRRSWGDRERWLADDEKRVV